MKKTIAITVLAALLLAAQLVYWGSTNTASADIDLDGSQASLPTGLYPRGYDTLWLRFDQEFYIDYGNIPPVSGTWTRGSLILNSEPEAGGNLGWICVEAGTPGTWKTVGVIAGGGE